VLSGSSDANIRMILNQQSRDSVAKPYQVNQVRGVLVRYKLPAEAQ
jgi:hypothetical protein